MQKGPDEIQPMDSRNGRYTNRLEPREMRLLVHFCIFLMISSSLNLGCPCFRKRNNRSGAHQQSRVLLQFALILGHRSTEFNGLKPSPLANDYPAHEFPAGWNLMPAIAAVLTQTFGHPRGFHPSVAERT